MATTAIVSKKKEEQTQKYQNRQKLSNSKNRRRLGRIAAKPKKEIDQRAIIWYRKEGLGMYSFPLQSRTPSAGLAEANHPART